MVIALIILAFIVYNFIGMVWLLFLSTKGQFDNMLCSFCVILFWPLGMIRYFGILLWMKIKTYTTTT